MLDEVKNPEFWNYVSKNPVYSDFIAYLEDLYSSERDTQYPSIKYSDRWLYYKTGSRIEMLQIYNRRRSFLSAVAILALLYPENEQYLIELQDTMWVICDEYSWAIPAHTSGELSEDLNKVDLYSAETGFALTEICDLLSERLEKPVLERVQYEIRLRVIRPYETHSYGWENWRMNWAAVCGAGVGACMMYLEPEAFKRHLPRLLHTMQCFLDGFTNDGTCLEGLTYWNYGFGYFTWFADLLYRFSKGENDILSCEKCINISSFPQSYFLCGGSTVSFSDGDRTGSVGAALLHFLHRKFPDRVNLPSLKTRLDGGNVDFVTYLRNFIYYDPKAKSNVCERKDYYKPDAGQVIINREGYSLAAKAGYNHEPHNHNDIGNFILSCKNGQTICDLGAGLYTKDYFDLAHRYKIFCNSSLGHNVPIVNGQPQSMGDNFRGELEFTGNTIKIEMANAYDCENLKRLTRFIVCEAYTVKLTDQFDGAGLTFTERFITLKSPIVEKNTVILDGAVLHFDSDRYNLSIKTKKHQMHTLSTEQGEGISYETVWCIDFDLKPGEKEFEILFSIL